ncbi:MAG: alkylation response protein AidB-like acyl-CoA dehydrogenase [Planctomycetota bacterium]|jgi:alkylation response protein AidB-like acyl-CoA dehydrogenase
MIPNEQVAKMYELTEEQAMLRETLAEFTNDEIIPKREKLDKEAIYPRAIHDSLAEIGVLGMAVPEDCGGLGMGSVELALVYEQLARGCAGVATGIGANLLGSDPILIYGTEDQKQRFLTKIAEGAVGAYALTEPNAGTDAGGITTTATKSEDGLTYKLKGQKTYITNAGIASIYTIFALTDPSKGSRGVTCFIAEIDPDNLPEGIFFPDKFDKMGINASETREIIFDEFEVRTENILGGKLGRGFLQAMGVFDISRPMIGAMGVGLGQSAFDASLRYAHERMQFGQAIINFSGLRQMFVDMWLRIEGARAMVMGAARKVDKKYHQGEKIDVTAWAAMAKFMGSEASRVSYDAMQATGGYGYMNETPFPKFIRDQKVLEIFEGTNQIQREQAGRQLINRFQKSGTAVPSEGEDSFAISQGFGGEQAALAWQVVDATMEQVLFKREGAESLNERQEVHWVLGEMAGLAEAARFLSEACARSGESADSYQQALGQTYAREAVVGVAARSEMILRGGVPEAHDAVAALLHEARTCANGLFAYRDRLGEELLRRSF